MPFDVPAILENCCFSVFIHMEYSFQGEIVLIWVVSGVQLSIRLTR